MDSYTRYNQFWARAALLIAGLLVVLWLAGCFPKRGPKVVMMERMAPTWVGEGYVAWKQDEDWLILAGNTNAYRKALKELGIGPVSTTELKIWVATPLTKK